MIDLASGIVAYRSLSKHYLTLFEPPLPRGVALRTSENQKTIDWCVLGFSIEATAIWGYGDLLFKIVCT